MIHVHLGYTDRHGQPGRWAETSPAANPADAICRAIDNMEAAGIDIDGLTAINGGACHVNQSFETCAG